MLMLDEPCSGLSRGERQLLTDLLLALGREITLIVIEHDMDVALRVAERVTMMHDGRVIVEGTPDEIRANELVHDLYLGAGTTAMSEPPLLAVEGLNAHYGSAHVLQDVSFELGEQAVAIIGRNGMGKTTLCAAIMGISPPQVTRLGAVRGQGARRQELAQDRRTSASATSRRDGGCSRRSSVDEHLRMSRGAATAAAAGRSSASTSCSRGSPSGSGTAAHSSRAASSRCSRSGARSSPTRSS